MGHDVADDRMADEGEIAHDVQDLVAHELVLEPQGVQDARIADDDGVLERSAERQAALPQPLHFLQEAEGAGRGDVLGEALLGDPLGARLVLEQRMVEADGVADLEVIRRVNRNALVAGRDLHRLQDLQVLARRGELLDARFLQQVQERRAAAVHDRHFAVIELDDDVVDDPFRVRPAYKPLGSLPFHQ